MVVAFTFTCALAFATAVLASCPAGLPRTYLSAAEPAESWAIWAQNFTITGCGFNAFDALSLAITLGSSDMQRVSCDLISITDTEIVCGTLPHTTHIPAATVTVRSARVTPEEPAGELVASLPMALAILLPNMTTVRPRQMALAANGPVLAAVHGLAHGIEYRVLVSATDQDPETAAVTPVIESGSRYLVFQSGVATRTGKHTVHLFEVTSDSALSDSPDYKRLSTLLGAASCAGRLVRARNALTGEVESLRGLSSLPDGFSYYDAEPTPFLGTFISEVVPGWLPRSPASADGEPSPSSAVTLRGANLAATATFLQSRSMGLCVP